MHGLGKKRTRLGRFLDKNKITQGWLVENAKLNRNTVTQLCGDDKYEPRAETVQKIISAFRKHGHDVQGSDFWG